MPSKHWRIGTAARTLGEPVERTRRRVEEGELPVVIRKGERLVPSAAVLELRERLARGGRPSSSKKEAAVKRRQQPTLDGPREFSAQTVSEAVDLACSELGVGRDELVYEVRDTGLLHVLGLDGDPATIVVHADASRSAAPPSVPSNAGASAPPSAFKESAPVREPSAAGREGSVTRYYSLGQAALVLQVPHPTVRAMVSQGRLRAETINGYLWFPSRDFEDFVVREYGRGRLGRVSEPYAAERVRGPNPFYPGDRGAASGSEPPRGEGREFAEMPAAPGPGAEDADRQAAPTAADHRRAVMEAAQRLRISTGEVRRRMAARELIYDPGTRRLLEVSEPNASGRQATSAETNRDKRPVDPPSSTPLEPEMPATDEYLSIPDVAAELGESVVNVVGRIGRRELETKQVRGKPMVRRESVLALKSGTGSVPPRPSKPPVPGDGRDRAQFQESAPVSAGITQEQGRASGNRGQGENNEQLRRQQPSDERLGSAREGSRRLRAELDSERARRQDDEKTILELQRQLEESKSKELNALKRLAEAKRELAEAREKPEPQGGKRLLGSIRRMLSQ